MIGAEKGKVKLLFSKSMTSLEPANITEWNIDAVNAGPIAESIAAAAFEADASLKPVGPALKATIVDRHRMKLTQRFALVLNSERANKLKSNGILARDLVDIALAEVF